MNAKLLVEAIMYALLEHRIGRLAYRYDLTFRAGHGWTWELR